MSSSSLVTTTLSAVAVLEVGDAAGDGEGLGDAVASCAIAMLPPLSIATVIARICFIKSFHDWSSMKATAPLARLP